MTSYYPLSDHRAARISTHGWWELWGEPNEDGTRLTRLLYRGNVSTIGLQYVWEYDDLRDSAHTVRSAEEWDAYLTEWYETHKEDLAAKASFFNVLRIKLYHTSWNELEQQITQMIEDGLSWDRINQFLVRSLEA